MRKLTKDDECVRKVCELYKDGWSLTAIGKELGINPVTAQYRLKIAGVKRRPVGSTTSPGFVPKVRLGQELHKGPKAIERIAKEIGVEIIVKGPHHLLTEEDAQRIRDEVGKQFALEEIDLSLCSVQEWELGWLGGLLDGEGCIALGMKGERRWVAQVSVGSTTPVILERFTDILTRLGLRYYVNSRESENKKWRRSWCVTLAGFQNRWRLLKCVRPYLTAKREEADLMIEFCERQAANGGSAVGVMKETAKEFRTRFEECRENQYRGCKKRKMWEKM